MRILLLGDTHGNVKDIHKPLKSAGAFKADAIVQVGDFGFIWRDEPRRFEAFLNVRKQFGNIPFYFLDGNHEDHDYLAELGATHDAGRFVELGDEFYYCPRGFAWEWDGVRFMTVGGAVSVDVQPDPYCKPPWPGRVMGFDWFANESISYSDMYRACEQGPVDVLLSHDVMGFPDLLNKGDRHVSAKLDRASESNRQALASIAEMVKPKLNAHGHYHYNYVDVHMDAVVYGLGKNRSGDKQRITFETERLDEYLEAAREQVRRKKEKLW